MDFYQRLASLTIVLLLLIMFIGSGIADTDPSFDINETIEHEMSVDHVMTLDGLYEDTNITYAATKWAVIDVDGEDREQQVLDEEEWKFKTQDGDWTNWVQGETAENVLARGEYVEDGDGGYYRPQDDRSFRIQRTENVDYQFNEPGRYAFTMTLAKMDGQQSEFGSWDPSDYDIEEVETDKYVFAVQEDGLINIVLE